MPRPVSIPWIDTTIALPTFLYPFYPYLRIGIYI